MPTKPTVSVVIPTRNRPELVTRAASSALAQTLREIEVVVVLDGPDPATRAALSTLDDSRLRVVQRPESGGAPAARNTGVREAAAEWTALLDDDDEWLPAKLATQLDLAHRSQHPQPIVASRLLVRTPRAEFVLPRRLPGPGEPLSEYLTVRHGLFHGEGFIQTSTILARTELFRRVPFDEGLRRAQELDWTLRCLAQDGAGVGAVDQVGAGAVDQVGLVYAPDPLVLWNADENRPRISDQSPWRSQFEWLKRSRPLMTRRAYAALLMSVVSSMAAPTHDPRVFAALLREAWRNGRPGTLDHVTFLQVWLVPTGLRRRVRDLALGRRRAREARQPDTARAGAR
ncbi:MAG: glycosyltransferase family 2 protein [Micromonosporaceae bacterium]|nr:glycosyltransferase family 2 protein [Micromonosporaceae bacterium]